VRTNRKACDRLMMIQLQQCTTTTTRYNYYKQLRQACTNRKHNVVINSRYTDGAC